MLQVLYSLNKLFSNVNTTYFIIQVKLTFARNYGKVFKRELDESVINRLYRNTTSNTNVFLGIFNHEYLFIEGNIHVFTMGFKTYSVLKN